MDERDPAAGNNLAQAATAGNRVDEPSTAGQAKQAWAEAALKALDEWFDANVRNSPASQRTEIYNAIFGDVSHIKEVLSNA